MRSKHIAVLAALAASATAGGPFPSPRVKWKKKSAARLKSEEVQKAGGVVRDLRLIEATTLVREGVASSGTSATHNHQSVQCEIVKSNKKTIWVRLPDGNIVKRKKSQVMM